MENNPDKIKVLFVITKSNWGGAQRYVYDLAAGLPQEQFEVAVALGGSGALIQKLQERNIRVIPILSLIRDVSAKSDVGAFFELWSIIRSEKPDVVHLNSAKASGLGALAARLAGVPKIIFTAHGWAFNEDRSLLSRSVIKLFSWVTVLLTHKTIAVSEAVKNDTQKWPFIDDKVVTIKNGVTGTKFFEPEKARIHLFARGNIRVPENAFVVGSIAELHNNKGLESAIEALAKLVVKNHSLYYFILGDGEEKERLNALVGQRGLQGRVFLLGFVDNASHYLSAFDAFILPSIKEGLPYVILEAGLAGLPVVASRVGGIPEVIEDGKTGLLVPARNPEAIAESVEKLVSTPPLAKRLGEALRERVQREFSLKRELDETIALYTNN